MRSILCEAQPYFLFNDEHSSCQKQHIDAAAFQYAEIYAQWGGIPSSLGWLETAYLLPDSAIGSVRVDALLDPLRKDPRFQAIERKLKLPN